MDRLLGSWRRGRPAPLRALAAVLLTGALAVSACGPTPLVTPSSASSPRVSATSSPAGPAARLTVTLGIYSGRPDPSWELGDAAATALLARIDALPATIGVPPEGGLGYHGFTLLVRRTGMPDRWILAYRGAVSDAGTGRRAFRQDPLRSIERLLLDSGRAHLAPAEAGAVEADLAGG